MKRISRDELYMSIAALLAQRSTCQRGHVGAVVVLDQRVVSTGYNGSAAGLDHCLDVGCEIDPQFPDLGCQRATHAELNAILWAANHGISLRGAHMYATYSPCKNCAQAIVGAGIESFTFANNYRLGRLDILQSSNVRIHHA